MSKFKWLFTAVFLLIAHSAYAQNPCTTALTSQKLTIGVAPKLYVESATFNTTLPDGSALIDTVTVSIFSQGSNPATATPVQSFNTAKTAWAAVPTFTNCYTATAPQPLSIPVNAVHFAAARFTNTGGSSGWASSNTFFTVGAPPDPTNFRLAKALAVFVNRPVAAAQRFFGSSKSWKTRVGR